MLPWFALRLKGFQESFPTLPFDCPAKSGIYSANSTSYDVEVFYDKNTTKKLTTTTTAKPGEHQFELPLPNGIYHCIIHLSTKDDPEGFTVMWQFNLRVRLGEEEF
jgi:hypothetical protein